MSKFPIKLILAIAVPAAVIILFVLPSTGLFTQESKKVISIAVSSSPNGIDGNVMVLPQHLITQQCYFEVLAYVHNTGTETIKQLGVEFVTRGLDTGSEIHRVGIIHDLAPGASAKVMLSDMGASVINMDDVLAYNCTDTKVLLDSYFLVMDINEGVSNTYPFDLSDSNVFNQIYLMPLVESNVSKEV